MGHTHTGQVRNVAVVVLPMILQVRGESGNEAASEVCAIRYREGCRSGAGGVVKRAARQVPGTVPRSRTCVPESEAGRSERIFTTKSLSESATREDVIVRLAGRVRRTGAAACLRSDRLDNMVRVCGWSGEETDEWGTKNPKKKKRLHIRHRNRVVKERCCILCAHVESWHATKNRACPKGIHVASIMPILRHSAQPRTTPDTDQQARRCDPIPWPGHLSPISSRTARVRLGFVAVASTLRAHH